MAAPGFLYFGRDVLDFGKELAITIGPSDASSTIFQGRISALEAEFLPDGSPRITALAEDRLQELRMKRRTRSFDELSDGDVIQQVAGEYSLTPDVSLNGPTHKVLAQVNQSDLAFLRERARSAGAELWVEGSTLHAKARTDRTNPAINLEFGGGLIAFSVRADLAQQVSEISVAGWDVAAKSAIEETAGQSEISAELNGGESGTAILEQALSARKEYVVHSAPLESQEARALAQARYRAAARRFITGSGVSDGDARIRVGCTLNLSGLGDLFDGAYYVTHVRHTFSLAHGFRTAFDVERPGLG